LFKDIATHSAAPIDTEASHRRRRMKTRWIGIVLATIAATVTAGSALAETQAPSPMPWELASDVAYIYESNGKTLAYKMGTNNAKDLLKGAKKVPKGTLFFMGANGQLFIRTGPYLDDDGKFKFGPG
jgi:hypothetical protein